jgi:hypothetical protein
MKIVRRKRRHERVPLRLSGDVTRWLEWSGSELRVRGDDGDAWSVDAFAASAGLEFAERDDAFLSGTNEEP